MAHYVALNVTTTHRELCATENEAWRLIEPRGDQPTWLGPDDRWELLFASGSVERLIAWGAGPCLKDDWIRHHRLAPR